jgi:predicted ATPase
MATGNLPAQLTPFIGRTDEMAAIVDRLDDPHCRLLTLVGPGGIGKTRLAIEVASRQFHLFPDGVYFVGLQPITSIDHIIPTVASATGFEFYDGRNPTAQLLHYLRDKHLFLILDNFEHLLPATDVVTELLTGAPQLKLLVTSREALNRREEWLFHVKGMPYPQGETIGAIDGYGAVKLFVERAQRVRHDFSLAGEAANVVRVCQLVEGMPLGLELAATWLRRLPCSEVAVEIQRGLDFLETDIRGVPYRHHSMRAVFDHSWKLLNAEERSTLMGLSVFRGGFRREAAEQVAGASLKTLSALVDKSILQVGHDGRYGIHELQRQYAEERLDETPYDRTRFRDLHCAYFAAFMNVREPDLLGRDNTALLHSIDNEINNIRHAWEWALTTLRVDDMHMMMDGVYYYTWLRSGYEDGLKAFQDAVSALRKCDSDRCRIALGSALQNLSAMYLWSGQSKVVALKLAQESVAILRRLDTRRELAGAVGALGWAYSANQEWDSTIPILEEAVALDEETNQHELQAFIMGLLGNIAFHRGRYIESEAWQQQALRLGRKIGDQRTIADSLAGLGNIALTLGEFVKARRFFEQSLVVARTPPVNSTQRKAIFAKAWPLPEISENQSLSLRRSSDSPM